jgi:hypothetical protein
MNKKVYQTYKEDVYFLPVTLLRTDGYYLQDGEIPPRFSYRDVVIFYKNGYSTSFGLLERNLQIEIKNKITQNKDTVFKDFSWWKIQKDSLIIEHYAETKRDMITWNYYERGRVLNDTMIELKFDYSARPPIKYRFIRTDSLPPIKNKARYLKKEWYLKNLNKSRKNFR